MGILRRKFTKEYKLEAVRRLESGVSMAEVARALEVSPNVFIAGSGSFGKRRATRFLARGSGAGAKARWPSWSARSASSPRRSIF